MNIYIYIHVLRVVIQVDMIPLKIKINEILGSKCKD